jgi:5'-3' exonuclease
MSLEGKTPEELANLAALADDVLSNPETATVFQRLIKKNNPKVSMPLIELEDKVAGALQNQNKQIEELTKEKQLNDAERTTNALYEALRDASLVTTRASFSELVKYASEKGFMTTESGLRLAAQHRAAEQEAAEPTPPTGGAPGFELNAEGELSKSFMKDPKGTARTVAAKAMDELRRLREKGSRPN